MDSPNPGPVINRPGLDPSSVDTFQRVRFCLPFQMKCIPTLTDLDDSHEMFSLIFTVKY